MCFSSLYSCIFHLNLVLSLSFLFPAFCCHSVFFSWPLSHSVYLSNWATKTAKCTNNQRGNDGRDEQQWGEVKFNQCEKSNNNNDDEKQTEKRATLLGHPLLMQSFAQQNWNIVSHPVRREEIKIHNAHIYIGRYTTSQWVVLLLFIFSFHIVSSFSFWWITSLFYRTFSSSFSSFKTVISIIL